MNNQQQVTIYLKDSDPIVLQGTVQHLTTGVLQVTVESTQQHGGFIASLSSNVVYGFPIHNIERYEIAAPSSTYKIT
jgi:hypothetical protein